MPLPMRPIPITPTVLISDAIEFAPFRSLTHVSFHSAKIPHVVRDDGSINCPFRVKRGSFFRAKLLSDHCHVDPSNCHSTDAHGTFNYGPFAGKSDSYFSGGADAFR